MKNPISSGPCDCVCGWVGKAASRKLLQSQGIEALFFSLLIRRVFLQYWHFHNAAVCLHSDLCLYSDPCICTEVLLCASQMSCLQVWSDNQLTPDILCLTQSIKCNCNHAEKKCWVVTVGSFPSKADLEASLDLKSCVQAATQTLYVICSKVSERFKVFYRFCAKNSDLSLVKCVITWHASLHYHSECFLSAGQNGLSPTHSGRFSLKDSQKWIYNLFVILE